MAECEVARVLKRQEERILAEWEREAKKALPAAASLSSLALRDSFPQIIDALVEALWNTAEAARLKKISAIHGHERALLTSYSIEQVLIEYNVLRETVIHSLERETELSLEERASIRTTFDQGCLQAAREFFRMKSATDTVTRAETLMVASRLQALQMITEAALTYASDMNRLLSEILAMLTQTLAVDTCAILLLTDGGQNFLFRAAQGIEEKVPHDFKIPSSRGVAGHALEVLHPVIIPDLTNVETASPVLRPAGVTSLMVVPLKIERKPIGVIQVGSLRRREFTIDEQAHIQIVADRIAIAVDHARLYSQVQQDNTNLQRERDLRENFVSALTHDLKSPIAAALLTVQLLQRRPENHQEAETEAFSRIKRCLTRANEMIENLLDVNRVHAGHPLPLQIESLDLPVLVREVQEEFEASRGRAVKVEGPESLRGYWSPRALPRILDNLLTNAVKYGAADKPLSLSISRRGDEVEIAVHNEGVPIPKEDVGVIFDRFARTKSAVQSKEKGWGLGLPLVRGLVEAHGGRVGVESSEETGTTFMVTLPVDSRRTVSRAA